jgi:lysozyme family protein
MANYLIPIPFIKSAEGKLDSDPNDEAAKNPCPYGYYGRHGIHTSAGYSWGVFSKEFGSTPDTATRFFMMSDPKTPNTADWNFLFKKIYWDTIKGDNINSQRIANTIVDFRFNSGNYATIDTQQLLDALFDDHLAVDRCFGQQTIDAINSVNEALLYQDIIDKRIAFYNGIVAHNPSQSVFLKGWLARIDHLKEFNASLNLHV